MQTYFLLRFSLIDSLKFVSKLTFRLLKKINLKRAIFDENQIWKISWNLPILQKIVNRVHSTFTYTRNNSFGKTYEYLFGQNQAVHLVIKFW